MMPVRVAKHLHGSNAIGLTDGLIQISAKSNFHGNAESPPVGEGVPAQVRRASSCHTTSIRTPRFGIVARVGNGKNAEGSAGAAEKAVVKSRSQP
jgi:hypothetical protein